MAAAGESRIFKEKADRQRFVVNFAEVCAKTGWEGPAS